MVFEKLKKSLQKYKEDEDFEEEYIEIDVDEKEKENKVVVKLFTLNHYDDVNSILNSIREGYVIAIIDIRNLRKRDSIELKRAVSKIKKTTEALEGSIAGFGENIIIVTPSFAKIHKEPLKEKNEKKEKFY